MGLSAWSHGTGAVWTEGVPKGGNLLVAAFWLWAIQGWACRGDRDRWVSRNFVMNLQQWSYRI